ncbi:MAG: hypothetical protein II453_17595 [Alphaproteobacteria bacterium]|nr:hypothetical protein [Alphaproteobacteria bacterium]
MFKTTMIEYFENVLYSQPKVDNVNMSQREIVVLVGHGQNVDFIRNQLWKLCQKLESKLGLEYSFNNDTKIFAIIKRYKEKIWMTRIYVRIVDKNNLDGLRPDAIMVYGSFLAEQMQQAFEFIQRHSYKADLKVVFLNRQE